MNLFLKPMIFLGTAILLFLPHLSAMAGQTLNDQSGTSKMLETITVTAQKQEENIQEVSMGITAFTTQGIEDAKISALWAVCVTRQPKKSFKIIPMQKMPMIHGRP